MGATKPNADKPWAHRDAPLLKPARRLVRTLVPPDQLFKLYFRMLDTPWFSEFYILGRGRLRHRRIRASTSLVIEGYPSSGNTFARQAFLMANPSVSPTDVCSHTHSPRVVVKAVRARVPCIVLVRNPRDAVSSTIQRFARVPIGPAFQYYSRYYHSLTPFRDQLVVAPFGSAISDFVGVLQRVNARYDVDFLPDSQVDLSSDAVVRSIEDQYRTRHNGLIVEERVSRPSSKRLTSDEVLQNLTEEERNSEAAALKSYHAFLDGAHGVERG